MHILSLIVLLLATGFLGYSIARAFPTLQPVARPAFDIADEVIARIAHEANRAYCMSHGDFSQRCWDKADATVHESALDGVRFLRSNPTATPEQMHANWSALKIAQGYRYGPVKCFRSKTHPCLVPYAELPEQQRFKDYLFSAIVRLAVARG